MGARELADRYRDAFVPAQDEGIPTYSPDDLAKKFAGKLAPRGEISDRAKLRLANIPKGPGPEGITSPPFADLAEKGLRTAAELPETVRKLMAETPTPGAGPLMEVGKRVAAGAVKAAGGLATMPEAVMASQMQNVRGGGILPGTAKTVIDTAEGLTGIPEIARQIHEGSFGKDFYEDPVGALMPYLMAAGTAKGAKMALEPKAIEVPERPPAEMPLAPEAVPSEMGGEQVLARNLPGVIGEPSTFPLRVQRFEEVGVRSEDSSKPHGLYTSPSDVSSPHADLGGPKQEYAVDPASNVLRVVPLENDRELVFRRGAIGSGSGVAAARELLGKEEFLRLKLLPRKELETELSARYPSVDWARYYDKQEMFEGLGGIEARKAGYDAIYDPSPQAPNFSEFVVLNEKIVKSLEPPIVPRETPAPTTPADILVSKGIEPSTAAAMGKNIERGERRQATEMRGTRVMEESTDATPEEINQLPIGQFEELAGLPRDQAAARANEMLAEYRANPMPAVRAKTDESVATGYATSIGASPRHPAPLTFAQDLGDRLRAINSETSPALAELEGTPIHTAAVEYMSARDNTSGLAALAFDDMKRVLPKLEDRVSFARFLNSEAAKAISKDPEMAGKVKIRILSPEEEAAIPAKAIDIWRRKVQPVIERYKEAAGIKGTRETESGLYSKLHAIEPDETLPWDMPVEPGRVAGTGGKARPPRAYAFGRARAAMRATGTGDYYSVDLKDIIEHTLQDRIPRAAQNGLLKTVESYKVKPDENGTIPKYVPFEFRGGRVREVPVVPVDLLKSFPMQFAGGEQVYSTKAVRTIMVPAPVREAMNQALLPARDINIKLVTPLARLATSSQLASFAEGLGHSYVVLSNIWNMPGAGRSLGGPGKFIARLGPIGRIPMIVADVMNVSGEAARADYESGFKYGGFRASQLAGQEHAGLTSLYEKVPGIKQMKEAIFGLRGLEMRSRVALKRAAQAADPTLGDAAAWSKVNNELGSYVRDLQPPIVRFLRGSGIDPFAAAGVASIKTGIKSLAGRNIQGFTPEVWWNSLIAPAVTLYLVSKAMDDKHRDPWEVPGYKPGYVLVHSDQHKTVWVNASKFLGPAERGLRALGITSVMTRIAKGEATGNDLVEAWVQGLLNTPLGRLGPIHRVGFALMGTAPYVTSRWDLLRLTPKSQTRQVKLNVQEALKQASPFGLKAIPSEGELTPDTVPGKVAYMLSRAAAVPVSIRGSEKGFASGLKRSGASRAYDVARDIAYSADNIRDSVERRKYVIRRLMLDVDPKYRVNARKTVDSMMARPK